MNVAELITETDKLTSVERAEFARARRLRWNPGYEQRRQEVGQLLREGWDAAQRGEVVEGTEENLERLFEQALTAASKRRKNPAASCPA